MKSYAIETDQELLDEIQEKNVHVDSEIKRAEEYIDQPDVDDIALARMFIESGFSEKLSYWLVRMAEVHHAPEPQSH